MKMFRCESCGHLFEDGEEKRWVESHGEKLNGCPICFSPYEKVKLCILCEDNYVREEDKFCIDCEKYYKKHFKDLMNKTYTKEERELINIIFDGEEI